MGSGFASGAFVLRGGDSISSTSCQPDGEFHAPGVRVLRGSFSLLGERSRGAEPTLIQGSSPVVESSELRERAPSDEALAPSDANLVGVVAGK